MTPEVLIVLVLLAIVIIAFALDKLSPDVVALGSISVLMVTGILSPAEGLSGFSNPATITILALFFISEALKSTGVIRGIGRHMLRISNQSVPLNVMLIMIVTALASAFINTTAVVIVFLPVVLSISKARNINPSVLLMPLSFGAIIGGASTTIGTSTNLIISDVAVQAGLPSLRVFEFTHIGVVLFAVILGYMMFAATFLIKRRKKPENRLDDYDLKNYFSEITLGAGCSWIDQRIEDVDDIRLLEIDIIRIIRDASVTSDIADTDLLREGDVLLVRIPARRLIQLRNIPGLQVGSKNDWEETDLSKIGISLTEIMVNANSSLIGKTIPELNFKQRFNLTVLGLVGAHKRIFTKRMKEVKLRFGDTLLVERTGKPNPSFYRENDLILLQELEEKKYRTSKKWLAGIIVAAVVLLAACGILPILVSALAGATLLFLTGCANINDAYQSVEWKIIFLLAGLIPLGIALEKTGSSDYLASLLTGLVSGMPVYWALVCLYLITTLLTSVIYNNATAVIIAPIMLSIAPVLDVSPLAMLGMVMFAANCCFLTPVGYQTNLLIYGPGHYKFRDFLVIGGPLSIILALVCAYLVMLQ